ncbi:MAG: hypothetical protein K0R00_1521 [Herbinix sp.]|nr:hypothetical protein [Herbinix sp.]
MESKRAKMDRENRAKQFMPFDALKGLREALAEKERIIVPKHDLSEEQKEEINLKLSQVRKKDVITVEFFKNIEYVQLTGMVSQVDNINRILVVVNTKIPFEDISNLHWS